MLILGLLLVVVSAAGAALLISYNSSGGPEQMVVLFGRDWVSVTPLQAFIAGLAVALVFCVGVWMIVGTERRRRATRSEYRAVRREARSATKERDRLAKQLAKHEEEEGSGWTQPEKVVAAEAPKPEPRRGFGRHFRRSDRADEAPAEEAASSHPPQ